MDSPASQSEFLKQNLPLVHSLCKRFTGKGVEYDDLFGAGSVGLVKAARNFDPARGFSFSTYAVPVILGEIRRLFRDGGSVKISRSVKELYLKSLKAQSELEKTLSRAPTLAETAAYLCVTKEELCFAVNAMCPPLSLTAFDEGGERQIDLPAAPGTDRLLDKITVEQAISRLESDEAEIIKLRYFKLLTQQQTAKALNMTQVQVSRREKRILLKMRAMIGSAS